MRRLLLYGLYAAQVLLKAPAPGLFQLADAAGRARLERAVSRKSRPPARDLTLRQRTVPRGERKNAGCQLSVFEGHAVHLSGSGVRHDELAAGKHQYVRGRADPQPAPGLAGGKAPCALSPRVPRLCSHARAMDRRRTRRVHDRYAVVLCQRKLHEHQRRAGAERPGFDSEFLQKGHRAAQEPASRPRRQLSGVL